jgi:hypothetical protein
MKSRLWYLGSVLALTSAASAEVHSDARPEQFLAHPVFNMSYKCSEHAVGELPYLGDDLGQDCVPEEFVEEDGRAFMRAYRSDGLTNEDWYGWNRDVLSPCDCEVVKIHINPVTNVPGVMGKPAASSVTLRSKDGTLIVLAHIQAPSVHEGDKVVAGQVIAKVGNNGMCRNPHIHIGAWRGKKALQIRWDQSKIPII